MTTALHSSYVSFTSILIFWISYASLQKETNVVICDLTIHELYLANTFSWVIKRNAEVKPKIRLPKDAPVAVDAGSIELTKQGILHSDWFNTACQNPTLVTSIKSSIATRVINESIYLAQR